MTEEEVIAAEAEKWYAAIESPPQLRNGIKPNDNLTFSDAAIDAAAAYLQATKSDGQWRDMR